MIDEKDYLQFLYELSSWFNELVYHLETTIKDEIDEHFPENQIGIIFHRLLQANVIKKYLFDGNDTLYDINNKILKKEIIKIERKIKLEEFI